MSDDFYTVKIGHMYYRITSDDDADYVRYVAKQANELLSEIKSHHTGISDVAAAVLALLNTLDRCNQLENKDYGVYEDLALSQKQLAQVEAERLRLREQLWSLKKDLLYYRNLCEVYEEKLSSISLNIPTKSQTGKRKSPNPLEKMQQSFDDMEVYEPESK